MELNAEDVQEEFPHIVSGKDLIHHVEHVLPVGTIKARVMQIVPSLLLALLIHPSPVGIKQNTLVVKLKAVITNH